MAPLMAGVFARRGVDAWVFRGDDGLDELTTTTTSRIWAVEGGRVREVVVHPGELGVRVGTPEELRGANVAHNADVVRRVIAGERGPVRDAVVLNAGAALAVYAGEAGDPVEGLRAGIARAEDAVDSGAAQQLLEEWVRVSGEVAVS
jgi:anthranilate phosphoribosyltransferase